MIAVVLSIVSLILDGILSNFIPYMKNDLTLFTPMFSVVVLFFLFPFYRKDIKKYYLHVFLFGIVYDLFYTNLLFWNAVLFLLIAWVSKIIQHNFEMKFWKILFQIPFLIFLYESCNGLLIYTFHLVPISFPLLFYKISHSLLLNTIYAEIIYLLLKFLPKKYKKAKLN